MKQSRFAEEQIIGVLNRLDPLTGEFVYTRWLGDRKGIEEKTKTGIGLSLTARPTWKLG